MSERASRPPGKRENVSGSAFRVVLGGVFGMVAGLASQIVIASLFGTGLEMDAYLTALVVPAYVEGVLLSGLQFVFVPAFIQAEADGAQDDAWALAGTFVWLTAAVLGAVTLLGALGAPTIIGITAPGLSGDKATLSASMLRVLILAVPLQGLGSLSSGIQNARDSFFWPAVAAAIGSIGNLLVLLIAYRAVGPMALAWGYLAAAGIRAAVTMVPVLRHSWTRLVPLNDPRVRSMATLIAPFIISGIVTRWTPLLERYYASHLPDGDLSYLGYAGKVSHVFETVLGTAIATAIFPAMARAYALAGERGLVERAEEAFRLTMAVAMPVFWITAALATPIVGLLYQRGAFDAEATLSVSRIVPVVMLGTVVVRMLGNVMSRTFYVTKDTRTVPAVAAVSSILYVFAARALVERAGYVGLAWAQPLYAGPAFLVLCGVMFHKLRAFRPLALIRDLLTFALAGLLAYAIARVTVVWLAGAPAPIQLVVGGLASGGAYMGLVFAIDRRTAQAILEMTGARQIWRGARAGFRQLAQTARG